MSVSRGQSDTVGVVLLTAVVVVSSVTVGAFLLGNFDGSGDREPTVAISSDVEGRTVVIEHRGGDSYNSTNVRVLVRQQDSDDRGYDLGEFSLTTDGDEQTFASGDRWEKTIDDLNGELQVLVVDENEGEILHEATYVVAEAGIRIEIEDETFDVEMRTGEQRQYTVFQVFEGGTTRDITENATVRADGSISVDASTTTVTAEVAGAGTLTAETEAHTDSIDVSAVETDLQVGAIELNEPVTERETLSMDVTVENVGDASTGGQDLTVSIRREDGSEIATRTQDVTLSPDDPPAEYSFTYETEDGDAPELTINATTADDPVGNETTATVEDRTPGGSGWLGILENETPVESGDSFDTYLTYENPEDADKTVLLRTTGAGTEPDSTEIEIEPGESRTPTQLGFPEQGTIVSITDDPPADEEPSDQPEVTVEIEEQ